VEALTMYARFTDRARRVMRLANKEAHRFSQEYISTEHVLLGLVEEGSGVGANVLKNLDIDLHKIRPEVEKIVQSGPDMVTWGKMLPMTAQAKGVIKYSIEEARNLGHNYVGTEHLLLGLFHDEECVAAQVLRNLGFEVQQAREGVMHLLGKRLLTGDDPGAASDTGPNKTRVERLAHWLGSLMRKISLLASKTCNLDKGHK